MAKLVTTVAPLRSVYDVDFKILIEEHDLGVGKNLTKNVDFVLADRPYNVYWDQTVSYAAYNVFGLKDMKEMGQVSGDNL